MVLTVYFACLANITIFSRQTRLVHVHILRNF